MRTLYNMGVAETIPMLYPRMFQLHDMQDPIGSLNELNQVVLPPRIRMSGERLDSMGAYLIENGQQLILWLGKSVPVEFLRDVIGVNDLTEIDLNTVCFVSREMEMQRYLTTWHHSTSSLLFRTRLLSVYNPFLLKSGLTDPGTSTFKLFASKWMFSWRRSS